MPTKIFDTVVYNDVGGSLNLNAAEMLLIDLAFIGADVDVTFPTGATEGQAIGIQVYEGSGSEQVILNNVRLPSAARSMSLTGDCAIWTYSATDEVWELASYSRASAYQRSDLAELAVPDTTQLDTFSTLLTLSIDSFTIDFPVALLIDASCNVSADGTNPTPGVHFRIQVDGNTVGPEEEVSWEAPAGNTTALMWAGPRRIGGLPEGSHTVTLQWRLDLQTGGPDEATALAATLRVIATTELP